MLKLAGCVMLIAAGSLWGMKRAEILRERRHLLELIIEMMTYSAERIRYLRCTVDALKGSIKEEKRFSPLNSPEKLSLLSASERSELDIYFSRLGTTDSDGQQAMIALSISGFEHFASLAREEEKRKCRLYEVLGFVAGAFAAVILI